MSETDKVMKAIEEQNRILGEYQKDVNALTEKQKNAEAGQAEIKEKLARMDSALDAVDTAKAEFEAEVKKMRAIEAVADIVKTSAHAQSFVKFMRKGDSPELSNQLRDFEKVMFKNAVDVTTGANGEFAVPDEMSRAIYDLAGAVNTMRSICRVIQVSTPNYEEIVNKKGASAAWVGETDARSATDTPSLAKLTPYFGELSAYPLSTQHALDDIFFDVGRWLVENVIEAFIDAEEAAFISGNGTSKPKGFLAYTINSSVDGTRDFGAIQYVASGAAAAFDTPTATVSPADAFIDAISALKPMHLGGAVFLMNRLTKATVRKFKDYATGNFIWQPGIAAGEPDLLLGYPLKTSDSMPAIGADAYPVAFGNFKKGYTIVDRLGVRVLRDPYSNKPYVGFYTTKRVGGFVKDSEAIKVIKIASS